MESITLEELQKRAIKKQETFIKKDDSFICKECGEDILAAIVIFSIHDGPFPMSGSGQTIRETFPYCPKCEEKPEFHGIPITPK